MTMYVGTKLRFRMFLSFSMAFLMALMYGIGTCYFVSSKAELRAFFFAQTFGHFREF